MAEPVDPRPETSTAEPRGASGPSLRGGAIPTPYGRSPEGDLSLADFVALLRTLGSIILSRWVWGAVAATVVGLAGGVWVARKPTFFKAQTSLLAQSPLDQILNSAGDTKGGAQEQENSLRNHLSVMQSRRYLALLAQEFPEAELNAVLAASLREGEAPSVRKLEDVLSSRLDSERERGREFFTLSFSHTDPELAIRVVDRAAAAYVKLVQNDYRQARLDATHLLETQAKQIQAEITRLENERRDFRKDNNIVSIDNSTGVLAQRLSRLDSSLSDARILRVRLEKQVEAADASMAKTKTPFDNALLANFGNNQLLRQDYDKLLAQREVLGSRYGPNHPKMRDIDSSIRGLGDSIAKGFDLAYRDLKSQYEAAKTIETQLQKEFDQAFQESIEVEKLAGRYSSLGAEVEANRSTLADLLKRISQTAVLTQLPPDVMRVVDPGYIEIPRIPKKVLYGVLVALATIGAFLVVPLVLHVVDPRLKGASDVEKTLGKSLLGGIPHLKDIRAEDRPHVVRDGVDVALLEVFMSLVAQLDLSTRRREYPKVLLFSSTLPAEGKSMTVSNLAAAFTQFGKRTLIIDFDLRRPTLHRAHKQPDGKGFLVWAKAGYPAGDPLDPASPLGITELPHGTYLLCAGGEDSQPTQFFVAKQTAALFEQLRSRFDVILVDTPPVGYFQDGLVLARYADYSVLVAREGLAPVAQILRNLEDLDKTPAPIVGVILNDFSAHNVNTKLAYGYTYGSYGYARYYGTKDKGKETEVSKDDSAQR